MDFLHSSHHHFPNLSSPGRRGSLADVLTESPYRERASVRIAALATVIPPMGYATAAYYYNRTC